MSEKKYIDAGAWLARVNPSWMYTNLARKIIREAPAAAVFTQWISTEERMPQESDEYIVMIAGAARPTVLYFDASDGRFFEETEDSTNFYKVTHWMALPTAPGVDCDD